MRNYSNLAQEMTLTSGVSAADTVLPLSTVTGLPASFPFTLVIEPGTSSEEVVTCTALFGTSATVTRGSDGTSAKSHAAASKVRHMLSARDLAEPQAHIDATSGVHGIGAGSVVGTTLTQTLTGKSMSGSSNTFTNIPKSAIPTDTVYLATAQTLTNKTLDGASNTFSNIPASAIGNTAWSSYTPTWTASVTNPTLGNGTVFAQYLALGKTIHFRGRILFDTTTTFGSGVYTVSLPVAANPNTLPVGQALLIQGTYYTGVCLPSSGAAGLNIYFHGSSQGFSATVPATLTSTGALYFSGTYQAA